MRRHKLAGALFLATLAFALAWEIALARLGAQRVGPGETVVAIFPPALAPVEVIARVAAATPRPFRPLGFGNAWLVQASEEEGLAEALQRGGAILVLRTRGPLHFALGCAPRRESG